MNFKTQCWDLSKACQNRGLELKFALSAERDKYVKHHRTFGGIAWVWLEKATDSAQAIQLIRGLDGVEAVLTKSEAVAKFHLLPERIGDLVVLGDKRTVFGEMETEHESLPDNFRTHGSLHENEVPVVIYNAKGVLPNKDDVTVNFDLTRTLYQGETKAISIEPKSR